MGRVKINRRGMRTRLLLQKKVAKVEQQYGTPVRDWDWCNVDVRGLVQTITGREVEQARMLFPSSTHRVTIPFLPDLTQQHRFVMAKNGRILEIGHINNVEQADVKLICLCEEIGPR